MKRLWDAWSQRSARERWLMLLLCAVLVAAGVWKGGWVPLQNAVEEQQQRLRQLHQFQRLAPQMPVIADLPGMLRAWAAAEAIALASVQEQQDGRVRLTASMTQGDVLLAWLMRLEAQDGLRVLDMDLRAAAPPDGRVTATLLLEQR